MEQAVLSLTEGDSGLSACADREGGAVILAALSEPELDGAVERLQAMDFIVGEPRVILREALLRRVEVERIHNSAAAGPALVRFTFAPALPGSGLVFRNCIESEALPDVFVCAVERSARAAAGLTMDVAATLTKGGYHVDSSPAAFEMAAREAIVRLRCDGAFVRLEPIMILSVWTPAPQAETVVEDLRKRGAGNPSKRTEPSEVLVFTDAPLVRLLGYHRDLAKLTAGKGRLALAFKVFRPVEFCPDPDGDPDLFPPAAAMRA